MSLNLSFNIHNKLIIVLYISILNFKLTQYEYNSSTYTYIKESMYSIIYTLQIYG